MRKFVAVFIATVAGLVVLLSFKTAPAKTPPAAALDSATPGSAAASASPADSSTAPVVSSPAASSVPAPTTPVPSTPVTPTPAATPTATKSSAKPAPTTSAATTKTVTGAAVVVSEGRREYGVITVQLTLVNGKITKATASEPTTDQRSSEIASFAIPVLNREVVSSQTSQIQAVSGATITSDAYARSLQSAIDKAKA